MEKERGGGRPRRDDASSVYPDAGVPQSGDVIGGGSPGVHDVLNAIGEAVGLDDESGEYLKESSVDEKTLERAREIVSGDVKAAETLQEELGAQRQEQYKYYRGKELGNEREGRSKVVSSDVMDAIEWIMPSLMRIYFGGDVVSCTPMGPEDAESAERVSELLNYQFLRRGNGFTTAYKWFKDALVFGMGIVKTGWEDRKKPVSFFIPEMTGEEFDEMSVAPDVHIRSSEEERIEPDPILLENAEREYAQNMLAVNPPPPGLSEKDVKKLSAALQKEAGEHALRMHPVERIVRNVRGRRMVLDYSGPAFSSVPNEDFLYDPEAEDLSTARFVVHRVKRSPSYLREMEKRGIYRGVEDALAAGAAGSRRWSGAAGAADERAARYGETGRTDPLEFSDGMVEKEKREAVTVYEWWGVTT